MKLEDGQPRPPHYAFILSTARKKTNKSIKVCSFFLMNLCGN